MQAPTSTRVLIDLNYARDTTSGQEGLDLLGRLRALDPTLPVVVMTAWASVDLAVEAMRRGARDFVPKPWENARLAPSCARRSSWHARCARRSGWRPRTARCAADGTPLIAESPAMQPVLELIARVGPSDANVPGHRRERLRQGHGRPGPARGVGARRRRWSRSTRAGSPEGVFESELFGHVRGAFTDAKADRVGRFELADGGTLFLDEIANVPTGLQPKLLRVLETGEFERVGSSRTRRVDVRVRSARPTPT